MNLKNKMSFSLITMLYLLLMVSTLFNNFILLWIIMEISSLIYITLMNLMNYKKNSILYFLISSISGILMMLSLLLNNYNNDNLMNNNLYLLMLMFSLWMKLSMFPMHFWSNIMLKNINYMLLFLFTTLMKLLPMLILYYMYEMNMKLMMLLMMVTISTPFLMISQQSLKLMFIYSSMSHTSLMIMLLYINNEMWTMYFSMYFMTSYMILHFLNKLKINNMMSMKINLFKNKNNKIILMMLIMIYCQFPPFTSFIMKINISENLIMMNEWAFSFTIIMIMMSTFTTFNYLNYFNLMFLNNQIKPTYMTILPKYKKNPQLNMSSIIMLNMLMIIYFIPMNFM